MAITSKRQASIFAKDILDFVLIIIVYLMIREHSALCFSQYFATHTLRRRMLLLSLAYIACSRDIDTFSADLRLLFMICEWLSTSPNELKIRTF